jgi:hypothetical protein
MYIGFPFCVFLQKTGVWVCQEEHQQSGLTKPGVLMVSLMGHRVGRLPPSGCKFRWEISCLTASFLLK